MADKQIASLFGAVGFKIDDRGLMQFHQRMQKTSQQMQALGKLADGITAKLSKITGKSAAAGGLNTSQLAKDVARLEILLQKVSAAKARAQNEFNREALSAGKLVHAGKADELKLNRGQLDIEKQRLIIERLRQTTAQQAQAAELKMQDVRRRMAERQALYEQRASNLAASGRERALRVQRQGTALQQAQFRLEVMQAREMERRARRTPSEAFSRSRVGMGSDGGARLSLGPVGGLGAFALGLGFATSALGSFAGALNDSINKLTGQKYATIAAAGGGAAGDAANKWLDQYTDSRGLARQDIADQFTSFLASGQGAGLSNATTEKTFAGFGDLGTTLHLSGDRQAGMFRAVGQMLSKGQVMSEELKGQLGEHLPGAESLFAQAWAEVKNTGKAGQAAIKDLQKSMKAGQVGIETVLKAAEIAARRAAPTLEASSQTSQAQQNRAANRRDKAILTLGGAGISDANSEFFKRLDTMWLTVQDKAPALAKVYANLSVLAQNALSNLQSILLSSDNSGLMSALTEISYVLAEMSSAATTFFQVFSGKRLGALEALQDYLSEDEAKEFIARLDRVGASWTKLVAAFQMDLGVRDGEYLPGIKQFLANTAREVNGLVALWETLLEKITKGRAAQEDAQLEKYQNGNPDDLHEDQLSPYNQYRVNQQRRQEPVLSRDEFVKRELIKKQLNPTIGLLPIGNTPRNLPGLAEGLENMLRRPDGKPLIPSAMPALPAGLTTAQQLGAAPITLNLDLKVENAQGMNEDDLARRLSQTLPGAVQQGLRDAVGSMQARQSENE
ncbi:tape measure protein [Pseudomonas oryzihabitans]|uniref:tape measure protein n=1 Tax=Pseudomonas oryzihabitans TaxID=47885 RepID=UPI0011A1E8FF|nr:tape measure protein [Pseudomonas oryzihabitans]